MSHTRSLDRTCANFPAPPLISQCGRVSQCLAAPSHQNNKWNQDIFLVLLFFSPSPKKDAHWRGHLGARQIPARTKIRNLF